MSGMDNCITTTAEVGADWIVEYPTGCYNVLRGYANMPASACEAHSAVVYDDYDAHGIEILQDFDTTEIDKYIESLKKEVVTTEK